MSKLTTTDLTPKVGVRLPDDLDPAITDGTSNTLLGSAAVNGEFSILAVTGTFSNGVLSVFGDANANNIAISRNAAGTILVNGGAVPISGGVATVANTSLIQVFGLGGADNLTLDETNGALPRANLFGGTGNDVLTGGSGADMLFGQSENDILNGRGGNDFLFGGTGNDVLTGGDGNDQVFGETGNDRMIWNPGDDTDLFEGGADNDTAEVNGGGGAEVFTTRPTVRGCVSTASIRRLSRSTSARPRTSSST